MIRITQTGEEDYLIQSSQKAEKNINKKQQKRSRRSREAEEKKTKQWKPWAQLSNWTGESVVWVRDPLDQPRFLVIQQV